MPIITTRHHRKREWYECPLNRMLYSKILSYFKGNKNLTDDLIKYNYAGRGNNFIEFTHKLLKEFNDQFPRQYLSLEWFNKEFIYFDTIKDREQTTYVFDHPSKLEKMKSLFLKYQPKLGIANEQ